MKARGSLVTRVVGATIVSATIAAIAAAIVSLFIADRLLSSAEDQRLFNMVRIALSEIPTEGDPAPAVRDEVVELASASMRLAVRKDQTLVGGDDRLPKLPSFTCTSLPVDGATLRACGIQSGAFNVVVGSVNVSHGLALALPSVLAAALAAAAAASLFGRRTARWALLPLTELTAALHTIDVEAPGSVSVPANEAHAEIATLRETLSALLDRLGESLGTARRFAAEAAHEMKTPLTAIRAELDLLSEQPLPPEARVAVEKLRTRTFAMQRLVERLLTMANVSERSRLVTTTTLALEDLVRDALARLGGAAEQRVTLKSDAQGMVIGDEALLGAMVENVIENALKFSEHPVDVWIEEAPRRVTVRVRDRGPGVPPTERARAFEPFFRSPSARGANKPGHGIGLALVAQIARVHGGHAEFVDLAAHERGAEVTISLPAPP